MKIEFVNHAAMVVESRGVRLLMDPWLSGSAFDDGWQLLCDAEFGTDDFASITHIWFSHEHPDHFSPRDLTQIPESVRRNIQVIYQATSDGRLVGFCRKLGFQTRELEHSEWIELASGLEVCCAPVGYDSWLAIRSDEATLLNINDCDLHSVKDIELLTALGKIDLLCTQFSYAAWQGNEEDVERRRGEAQLHLDSVRDQATVLKPRYVLPFASFVWFCHEENFYLNNEMNTIHDAAETISERTDSKPLVMFPGDDWIIGEPWDNQSALDRYAAEYDSLQDRGAHPLLRSEGVTREQLLEAADKFFDTYYRGWKLLNRLYLARSSFKNRIDGKIPVLKKAAALVRLMVLSVEPASIFVNDHNAAYRLDMSGMSACDTAREDCDVSLSSGSLMNCLKSGWGGETLRINGRYRENANYQQRVPWNTYPNRLFNYFVIPKMRTQGKEVTPGLVAGRLGGKALRVLGVSSR